MTELSGVRSSCDMLARNCAFIRFARSSSEILSDSSRLVSSVERYRRALDTAMASSPATSWTSPISSRCQSRASPTWWNATTPMASPLRTIGVASRASGCSASATSRAEAGEVPRVGGVDRPALAHRADEGGQGVVGARAAGGDLGRVPLAGGGEQLVAAPQPHEAARGLERRAQLAHRGVQDRLQVQRLADAAVDRVQQLGAALTLGQLAHGADALEHEAGVAGQLAQQLDVALVEGPVVQRVVHAEGADAAAAHEQRQRDRAAQLDLLVQRAEAPIAGPGIVQHQRLPVLDHPAGHRGVERDGRAHQRLERAGGGLEHQRLLVLIQERDAGRVGPEEPRRRLGDQPQDAAAVALAEEHAADLVQRFEVGDAPLQLGPRDGRAPQQDDRQRQRDGEQDQRRRGQLADPHRGHQRDERLDQRRVELGPRALPQLLDRLAARCGAPGTAAAW